jgi:Secretion system C-terminal sorting domain
MDVPVRRYGYEFHRRLVCGQPARLDHRHELRQRIHGADQNTTDGGESWNVQFGPGNYDFTDVCFVSDQTGWVTGYNSSNGRAVLWRTTNGGTSWTGQSVSGTVELLDVTFTNSTTGWAVGYYGAILHTTNAGDSWVRDSSGTGNDLYAVAAPDAEHVWVAGIGGTILKNSPPTSVPTRDGPLPFDYSLSAYPNPFNSIANLVFAVPVMSRVNVTVYDLTGRRITTLVDHMYPPGLHRVPFDASNLPSGVYFARLNSAPFTSTQKLLLLK